MGVVVRLPLLAGPRGAPAPVVPCGCRLGVAAACRVPKRAKVGCSRCSTWLRISQPMCPARRSMLRRGSAGSLRGAQLRSVASLRCIVNRGAGNPAALVCDRHASRMRKCMSGARALRAPPLVPGSTYSIEGGARRKWRSGTVAAYIGSDFGKRSDDRPPTKGLFVAAVSGAAVSMRRARAHAMRVSRSPSGRQPTLYIPAAAPG